MVKLLIVAVLMLVAGDNAIAGDNDSGDQVVTPAPPAHATVSLECTGELTTRNITKDAPPKTDSHTVSDLSVDFDKHSVAGSLAEITGQPVVVSQITDLGIIFLRRPTKSIKASSNHSTDLSTSTRMTYMPTRASGRRAAV